MQHSCSGQWVSSSCQSHARKVRAAQPANASPTEAPSLHDSLLAGPASLRPAADSRVPGSLPRAASPASWSGPEGWARGCWQEAAAAGWTGLAECLLGTAGAPASGPASGPVPAGASAGGGTASGAAGWDPASGRCCAPEAAAGEGWAAAAPAGLGLDACLRLCVLGREPRGVLALLWTTMRPSKAGGGGFKGWGPTRLWSGTEPCRGWLKKPGECWPRALTRSGEEAAGPGHCGSPEAGGPGEWGASAERVSMRYCKRSRC